MKDVICNMCDIGLIINEPILILDEIMQRCPTIKHPKEENGWYIGEFFSNGYMYCTYGNWETGEKHKYNNKNSDKNL